MSTPVILDCDPGHDDAFAILLAAADPHIDLLAITTVAGNQTLDKTTLNARRVCTVAGIDSVPIAAGRAGPLHGALLTAGNIHGESGLDGPNFPDPTVPLDRRSAVSLMHELLMTSVRPVTLVPVGPLSNIAALLLAHPEVTGHIAEIVLMGGSIGRGNTTPSAEFNILVDPPAADIVFNSGLPVTMVGLNATHQALATPDVVDRITAIGTPLARICVDLLTFITRTNASANRLVAPPLHDPVAVARVIDASTVTCVPGRVDVELTGTYTAGATVTDFAPGPDRPANALVATEVDTPRFWDLVVGAVTALG